MSDYDFMTAKKEYREFCEKVDNDIQIFAQPWYLDAVCDSPDDWRVIVYKENNRIVAAFPFQYTRSRKGVLSINNPWQAPRLGIWMDYGSRKTNSSREAFENKVSEYVIDNLPLYDVFSIAFDARFKNWRAFYNAGFAQETRYSYLISSNTDYEHFLSTVSKNRRKQIEQLIGYAHVEKLASFDEYWNFFTYTYRMRSRIPSYSREKFERLFAAVTEKCNGIVYSAKDCEGNTNAEHFAFLDSRRTYAMFGTYDPEKKQSARALITYNAIVESIASGKEYDFEGSMIPGVAQYASEFGAVPEPYFLITNYSPRMKFYKNIKENMSIIKDALFHGKGKKHDNKQ